MLPGHTLLAFVSSSYVVIPAMICIAMAYSTVPPALWPSVTLLIDEDELATGTISCILLITYHSLWTNMFYTKCWICIDEFVGGYDSGVYWIQNGSIGVCWIGCTHHITWYTIVFIGCERRWSIK
jgi:hypothetical protein